MRQGRKEEGSQRERGGREGGRKQGRAEVETAIRKAVFDEAGGKQHNITEAARSELKLGEGG